MGFKIENDREKKDKRKILLSVMLCTMIVTVGCTGNTNKASESSVQPSVSAQHSNVASKQADQTQKTVAEPPKAPDGTSVTKSDVAITISNVKVSPVIGDRTKDNVGQANGDYFAIGSDIVKASDYEQIEVTVNIDNKSTKSIHFSGAGWIAKMPDGYELKVSQAKGKVDGQIASNHTGEGKLIFVKEKTIIAKNVLLTYKLMDYGDEFNEAVRKAISGDLTKEEFEKQFKPQEMNFEVTL
jgi:hypothetical protein